MLAKWVGKVIVISGEKQFHSSRFRRILDITEQVSKGIDAAMAKYILCQQKAMEPSKLESKYAFGFCQINLHK